MVFVGFALFKLGIVLDIPIISLNLPVTAAIGCKLQDMGGLDGFVQIKLVLDPWVFKIKLFMEIRIPLGFFTIVIRLEFTLWTLTIKGFSWTLYRGDFQIKFGGKEEEEAGTMALTFAKGSDGTEYALPKHTPSGVTQN